MRTHRFGAFTLSRCVALLLLSLAPGLAGSYRFGAVWDGGKIWKDACISTEGERIRSVGACPPTAMDLSRYTAIPGMIDAHTHLTYILDNAVSLPARPAAVVFLSQEN